MDEAELEGISGEDLFKQLLRLLPTADSQDYIKNGVWQDNILKLDARILIGHRQEAGAPEICALEDVKMPEDVKMVAKPQVPAAFSGLKNVGPQAVVNVLAPGKGKAVTLLASTPNANRTPAIPKLSAMSTAMQAMRVMAPKLAANAAKAGANGGKPVITSNLAQAMAKLQAAKARQQQLNAKAVAAGMAPSAVGFLQKPGASKGLVAMNWQTPSPAPAKANPAYALSMGSAGGGTVTNVVANDLKQIAAFVAKWNLDTTKAKLALAKLTPPKRQYVMTKFTNQASTNKYGSTMSNVPAITKLEQFILQCNRTNAWGGLASVSSAGTRLAGAQSTPGKKVAPVIPQLGLRSAGAASMGAIGARLGQVKRPFPTSVADASKKPRLAWGGASASSSGQNKPIPHVVPKYGAGSKPTAFVVPKHKAAPPDSRSNQWSSSGNSASKNSWSNNSDNKSWGSGKDSWGSNKSWGKPQQEAASSGGGFSISGLLSKF